MEVESENAGFEIALQQMQTQVRALQKEYTKHNKMMSDQIMAMNQERMAEKMSKMEIDEDYIYESPLDIIDLISQNYGTKYNLYLDEVRRYIPKTFTGKNNQNLSDFKDALVMIFKTVPLVFPTDREKINYLYDRTGEHYQNQIKEIVKKPGKNRTFEYVFEQTLENGISDSWLETLHEYLEQTPNLDLDFHDYEKWLKSLDRETHNRVTIFLSLKMNHRSLLLDHGYEKGDIHQARKQTKRKLWYTPLPKPTKYTRQQFSTPKLKTWKPNKREQTKHFDDSKNEAKPKLNEILEPNMDSKRNTTIHINKLYSRERRTKYQDDEFSQYSDVEIKNRKVNAFIDTGANVSVMREDLAKQFAIKFNKEYRIFESITEDKLEVKGSLTLPVKHNDRTIQFLSDGRL
ncbi:hypothetical protein SOMG_00063 [Schizosaccharomyces osmophilus]|uniref:Uncharacterized protein n=1 Tax=Schizosaccharomyces osmophilus TaxID=2545709 RepID=A0AAF0ATV5_9SCHI|nr:uncharacterized protein SOMG_00063 [Schizosaccharomyces osmophilus]WBW70788.1 hypothetical protein SOMG_00063 [Schizosaccharomyces osmophilus]